MWFIIWFIRMLLIVLPFFLQEYIVVLVCNGKNQNQARDDLEAFLGEDSGRFVAWYIAPCLSNLSASETFIFQS